LIVNAPEVRSRAPLILVAALILAAGATVALASYHGPPRSATCRVPTLAGTTVNVSLVDMGAMMGGQSRMLRVMLDRSAAPAGAVSLRVVNRGSMLHELVVLPLPAGQSVGGRPTGADDRVSETGSVGEVSASCAAGAGAGLRAGTAGWTTLHLAAGRYELLCNLPGHYRGGMYAELDVP
jgi:uncharacterized cupredoxin-like copper-binding protein